jgi:hypothetical protein
MMLAGIAVGCLMVPGVAGARLPHPRTALIVPGKSIAGVKIDMTQRQVFGQWGATSCSFGRCLWRGPGNPSHAEQATVTFAAGVVVQIDINAGTSGTNERFKPGTLSKWKTAKNIHLGSPKSAVKRAYPAARANTSPGVDGFDLQSGIHFTRFSAFGIGATPNALRYIELACNGAQKC